MRRRRLNTRKLSVALACLLIASVAATFRHCSGKTRPDAAVPADADRARCTRVVDGDTIVLDPGGKARLIGVDTPETVDPRRPVQYFGKEASAFTKRMVEGKTVWIGGDWEARDKYGRKLVYVYLEDGTFFNAELIKQGYAHAYTRFPFKYLEQFRAYEREAREQQRGLWKASPESQTPAPASKRSLRARKKSE